MDGSGPRNGSSPLSRGILRLTCRHGCESRIIPALAGNTHLQRQEGALQWDHPRSRGEYLSRVIDVKIVVGSSPLSRGIRHRQARNLFIRRIIPALAGNTPQSQGKLQNIQDHPRSRGEYYLPDEPRVFNNGSSPLSRGIRLWCIFNPFRKRDHPRSRGEYRPSPVGRARVDGSSPLSRGIHASVGTKFSPMGIIPALAGNTSIIKPGDLIY